jgi:hypothetical protein
MVRLGTVAARVLADVRRAMDREEMLPGIDARPAPAQVSNGGVSRRASNKSGTGEPGQVAAVCCTGDRLRENGHTFGGGSHVSPQSR